MKIGLGWLAMVFALLTAGCSTAPSRTSGGFLNEAFRDPTGHIGQLVASFGSVVSIRESDGAAVFWVATPNYAYVFEVSYRGEIPALEKGRDVSFLGTIDGVIDSDKVYAGKILKVDAIAVQPFAKNAVYRDDRRDLAQSWLDRKLDVAQGGNVVPPRQTATAEPSPAIPAPAVRGREDATALKTFLQKWSASPAEARAKLRDLLERWNDLPDDEKVLFFDWNGLPAEDKALFRKLTADGGAR